MKFDVCIHLQYHDKQYEDGVKERKDAESVALIYTCASSVRFSLLLLMKKTSEQRQNKLKKEDIVLRINFESPN